METKLLITLLLVTTATVASACSTVCGGNDLCCSFTPFGFQTPIEACYNDDIYDCMQDDVLTGNNCLCPNGNGCFKGACYSPDYNVVTDLNGSGNKCLCKISPFEYCHNGQCFVDNLYDLLLDPVLNTKKNCPSGLLSCNTACYDNDLYQCCVKAANDGYLEQNALQCRAGYTPVCRGPIENLRDISFGNFRVNLDTCKDVLTIFKEEQALCTANDVEFVKILDVYTDRNGLPAAIIEDSNGVAHVYNPSDLVTLNGQCERTDVVYPDPSHVQKCYTDSGAIGLQLPNGIVVENQGQPTGQGKRIQMSTVSSGGQCTIIGRTNGFTDNGDLQFAWLGDDNAPYAWVIRPPSNQRDRFIVIRPQYNAGSVKLVQIVG